jgi:hypothetical protein
MKANCRFLHQIKQNSNPCWTMPPSRCPGCRRARRQLRARRARTACDAIGGVAAGPAAGGTAGLRAGGAWPALPRDRCRPAPVPACRPCAPAGAGTAARCRATVTRRRGPRDVAGGRECRQPGHLVRAGRGRLCGRAPVLLDWRSTTRTTPTDWLRSGAVLAAVTGTPARPRAPTAAPSARCVTSPPPARASCAAPFPAGRGRRQPGPGAQPGVQHQG